VEVSINLTKMMASSNLSNRALEALVAVAVVLFISSLLLIPGHAFLGVPVASGQCDPFTRNRDKTGDAWQSNLTTGDLTLGAIPNPCDEHG
jgi:hypothetical protein